MSNGGGGNTNTLGPSTQVKICFYTIGDNNKVKSKQKGVKDSAGSASDWFCARAGTLASDPSYVFGETSIYTATPKVHGLPPSVKIIRLYFMGHGNPRGFIMNSSNSESLVDPASTDPKVSPHMCTDSGAFLVEVANWLAPGFQIAFLGCRMRNNLVPKIATALSGKGLSGTICGYTSPCDLSLEYPAKGDYDAAGQEFTETINGTTWHHNQIPPYDRPVNVTP
jgi:hypothetical protein